MAKNNILSICSFNSTGFGFASQNYMDKLLLCSDILCVQEHFLLDCKNKNYSNTDKLKEKFNDLHDMYIIPAVKDQNQVTKGRGIGGVATIWKKCLTKYVSKTESNNPRIQSTLFELPECPLLIINVYFPCDPRTNQYDLGGLINLL